MYDKTHYNIVISLQLIKKKSEKKIGYIPCVVEYISVPHLFYTQ